MEGEYLWYDIAICVINLNVSVSSKTPRLGRKIIIVSFEEISEEVCRMRIDMYFLLMMLGPCFMTHQFNLYTKITKKWPSPQKEVV